MDLYFKLYEGSKAKRGKIAQQLDLLPETSKKLFKFHYISRNVKICILNVFTQEMKHISFRKVHFFWLLMYFICPKCWTNDSSFWCVIKILKQLIISLTLPLLNTEKVQIISVAQCCWFLLWTLHIFLGIYSPDGSKP